MAETNPTWRPFGARHSHTLVADNDVIYLVGGAPEVDLADEEEGASGYNPLSDTWISYDGGATWREERLQDGDHRNWKAYACQTRSGRFVFFRNLLTDSTTWNIPRGPATRRDAPPAAGVAAQTFFPHHPAGDPAAMPAEQTLSVALHMSPRFAHTAVLDPVKREIFVLGGHGQAAIVHRGQKQQAAGSGTAAQQQSARATHMAELQARADEQVFDDVWKLPFGDGARRWRKCAAGHQWPSPRYGASATLISGRRKGGSGARGGGGGGAVAMPAGGGYARRGGGGGGGGGGGVNSSILVIGGRGPDGKALGDVWTAEVDDGESLTWERLWPKQVDGGGGGGSGGGGAAATSGGGGGGGGGAADQQGGLWPKERAHHTSLVVKRAGAAVSAAQSPTGRRQPGGRGAGDSSQLLYVMGGQGRGAGAANELGLLSDVWLSKDRGRSWAEVTKEAEFGERCGHASVAGSNGELYVIGGLLVSADAAGAEQRFDASGTVVGEMELADEAAISDPQNDVWCSSDGGKSWECRCRNAPWRARFGHAAVMVRDANGNDAICIAGGQGSEAIEAAASGAEAGSEATMRFCALGDVWRSDDGGRTWRPPAPYAANTALLLTDSGTHLFNTEHETQTRLGGAGAYAAPGEQQGWSGLGAACYTPRAVLAFASTGLYALSPNLEAGAGAVALAGGAAGGAAAVAAAAAGGGGGGMGNLADASWTLMDARSEQSPWHRVVAAVHVGYGRAVVLTELGATLVTPASPMRQRSPLLQCEYFKECKAAVYIGKNKVLAFTANFGIIELNVTSSWDTTRRRSRIRQLGARADAPLKQSGEWAGIKCAVYLRGNGTTELPGNQVLAIVDRGIRVVDTITGAVLEGGEAAAAAMVGGAAAPPAPPVASPGGSVRRLLHQVSDTVTHALGGGSHGRGGSHHDLNAAANKHWREARVAMVHEASAEVLVFCGAQGTWRCRLTPPKPGSLAYTKAAWQATKCGTDLITGAVRGAIPLTGTVPQAPVPLPTRTVTVEKPFGTRAFHAAAGLPAPRGFHADEHSGTLVLVGGMVAGESRNDVWVSRTDGRHWDLANADSDPAGGKHFAPRCQHTLVVRKIPAAAGNPRDGRASHGGGGGGYDDGRGGGGAGAAAVQYDTFGQPIARGGQRRQQQQQQQQNSPGHSRASSRLPGGHSRGGGSTLTSHQSETTELIMIGGIAGLDATMDEVFGDIWFSRDEGVTWRLRKRAAEFGARYAHAAVAAEDGTLFVLGGLDAHSEDCGDVWRSDDGGANWFQPAERAARTAHSRAAHSRSASGGGNLGGERGMPSSSFGARSHHAAVLVPHDDGRFSIYVVGGTRGDGALDDVWRSETGGETWSKRSDFATARERGASHFGARCMHTCAVSADGTNADGTFTKALVLVGGARGLGDHYAVLPDIWSSSDGGSTWQPVKNAAPFGRRCAHAMATMPGDGLQMWVIGGTDGDVWRSQDSGRTWGHGEGEQAQVQVIDPYKEVTIMLGDASEHFCEGSGAAVQWLLESKIHQLESMGDGHEVDQEVYEFGETNRRVTVEIDDSPTVTVRYREKVSKKLTWNADLDDWELGELPTDTNFPVHQLKHFLRKWAESYSSTLWDKITIKSNAQHEDTGYR